MGHHVRAPRLHWAASQSILQPSCCAKNQGCLRDACGVVCRSQPEIHRRLLGACAGEQSGPQLWRIKYGGELARVNRPRVVHIMIGTNDFRANPCHGNPLALLLRVQAVFLR